MDTETIQQLITMFSELGGDAKDLLVWYLIVMYAPRWIWAVGGVTAVLMLSRYVIGTLQEFLLQERLREAAGQQNDWTRVDRDRLLSIVRKHWND